MNTILLVAICTISACLAIPSNFVNFGAAAGDTAGSICDDCYWGPFNFDFIFYGVQRNSLYVGNNGIISFNGGISQFTPVGMSAANFPAIAAYWGDVDTRGNGGGHVWYRSDSSDTATLAALSARISPTFHGNRMFVVTWDNVGYFGAHTDKLNNFQAVLIADAIGNSWVFLNYDRLEWTTGDASGGHGGLGGVPASVGFSAGDGVTYVQTAESLTAAVLNTHDGLYQVNGVTIVIEQDVCGDGVVGSTEQCDGGECCTSTCTHSMDAVCFCRRQTWVGSEYSINYFCTDDVHDFYMCLRGPWESQSRLMHCGAGTSCGCELGHECSCEGFQTPCVWEGTVQVC